MRNFFCYVYRFFIIYTINYAVYFVGSQMLHVITNAEDPYVKFLADDPVRPEISIGFRCHSPDNCVFVLLGVDFKPRAVLCCSFKSFVPSVQDQLTVFEASGICNAIFYSVWSYSRGSGREIIPLARQWITQNYPHITGFYTFSPLGDSVRDFHHGLGARTFRLNEFSVNYVY